MQVLNSESVFTNREKVSRMRSLVGATDCSQPGTIRGDFGKGVEKNVIHASATREDAGKALLRFRKPHNYTRQRDRSLDESVGR